MERYTVKQPTNVLELLRENGVALSAPCGGLGACGKCLVRVNGKEVLACQTVVTEDCVIEVPEETGSVVLEDGIAEGDVPVDPVRPENLLAVDIGTTTVVAFLLDGHTGEELARASTLNPQQAFGADVISRIQAALSGDAGTLQELITNAVGSLIGTVCEKSGTSPEDIGVVSVVGNPAMQQLFLGIDVSNLAGVPFDPVLTEPGIRPAKDYLPACPNADLLVVPDIAGYVGADTMACVLSCALEKAEEPTLLVDIGTNGEMVLSAGGRMAACSTAAGPALEGAKIRFGMRGAAGAIDKVRWEDGAVRCHVIGDRPAEGICGSGLIDAVAVYLEQGLINKRGRIQTKDEIDGERTLPLTDGLYLTQTDIREVMLAKGAVAAGIELMARYLGLELTDIKRVLLAGAFGSFLDPNNACRMGLLPEELQGRITAVGNAAGSGAKLIARSKDAFAHTGELKGHIEAIELANLDDFMHTFAKTMNFREVRHD